MLDLETGRECAFVECDAASVYFDGMGDLWIATSLGRYRHRVESDGAGNYTVSPPERLPRTANTIADIAGDRRGAILATAMPDGVRVWERERPYEFATFPVARPIAQHNYLAVSPDGNYFACGSHNASGIRVWDRSGKLIRELLPDTNWTMPAFSPDGQWLYDWHGARWNVNDWSEGPNLRWGQGVGGRGGIAYAPDMGLIAVDTGLGSIVLLDRIGKRELVRLEDPSLHNSHRLIFTPDGTKLLMASTDGSCLHVWDLRRIREGLVELGLDWDAPPYPKRDEPRKAVRPIDVTLLGKDLWNNPPKLAQYEWVAPLAALAVNPFDWEARSELGRRLVQTNRATDREVAYSQLRLARALQPDRFSNELSLATVCYLTARHTESVEAANRAMQHRLPSVQARNIRAQALFKLGRIPEAIVDFDFLAEGKIASPGIFNMRGHCHRRLGHEEMAAEDYRTYYSESKFPPEVLNSTARALVGPGLGITELNPIAAQVCVELAMKKDANHPRYLATLAAIEWERGRIEAARAALERTALRPDERDALHWYVLAKLQLHHEDAQSARDSIAKGDSVRTKFRDTSPALATRYRREALAKLIETQRSLAFGAVVGSIAAMKK